MPNEIAINAHRPEEKCRDMGVIVSHPARPVIEDRRERDDGSEKPSRCYSFTQYTHPFGPIAFAFLIVFSSCKNERFYSEIAFMDQETGECDDRQLNHSDGEGEKFYRELKQRRVSGDRSRQTLV